MAMYEYVYFGLWQFRLLLYMRMRLWLSMFMSYLGGNCLGQKLLMVNLCGKHQSRKLSGSTPALIVQSSILEKCWPPAERKGCELSFVPLSLWPCLALNVQYNSTFPALTGIVTRMVITKCLLSCDCYLKEKGWESANGVEGEVPIWSITEQWIWCGRTICGWIFDWERNRRRGHCLALVPYTARE